MNIDKIIIKEFKVPYQYQHIINMSVNEGYNQALVEVETIIKKKFHDYYGKECPEFDDECLCCIGHKLGAEILEELKQKLNGEGK